MYFSCDVTIIPSLVSTREEVLQVLPGHHAVFLSTYHGVNAEFLNIAGKSIEFCYQ